MLLANNMLHFGSAKNNNKTVFFCNFPAIIEWSCVVILPKFCEPGNTTYILEVSSCFPGVLESLGWKAFRDGTIFKKLFFQELQLDQENPSHFLEIVHGKGNPG